MERMGNEMTTSPGSRRPRIVCHMAASLDGRIVVDGWPESVALAVRREYERVHASYEADGWICGRVTMEPFAKRMRSEADVAREYSGTTGREDFRAPGDFETFAFAIDPSGRLAWETNDIDGDHVVAILSERVSDDYLAFLRGRGVSYLLPGKHDVDEVSVLVAPAVDGRVGTPTLFDLGGDRAASSRLVLEHVERRPDDVLWLRYRVEPPSEGK